MPGGRFSIEAIFRAQDRMRAPIARMERQLDRFTRRATLGMHRMDRAMAGVHRGISRVGFGVAAAGAAGGAGLAAMLKPAFEVEDALLKVGTVVTPAMGTVQEALRETQAAAVEWSKRHVASIEEFLGANYNMASAGLDSAQALAGTRSALTLATATMGDATTAGNLLATVYNNLGDRTADANREMARIGDQLARTQALFQIADLSQLNESLKMGAPAAIQYGVALDQLNTTLGALNTAGLQGSMAGTAFSASMRQMQKASRALHFEIAKAADGGVDFLGTLANMEAKFGSFATMSDKQKAAFQRAFGDEGIRAVALLMGKTDELSKSLEQVANSGGAAAKAAALIESSKSNKLAIFGNRIEAIAATVGENLFPALEVLGPQLESIADRAGKWVTANEGLIKTGVDRFARDLVRNLPTIVTWTERGAKALAAFYGARLVVGTGKLAMDAVDVAKGMGGAFRAVRDLTRATRAATEAQVALDAAAGATSGRFAGLRGALNASALGTSINGVTSKLGKAGLLGAALGVGYAFGTWLDHKTGISKMISEWAGKLESLNVGLESLGATLGWKALEDVGRGNRLATDQREAIGVSDMRGSGVPSPQVVGPELAAARVAAQEMRTTMREELHETVDVNVNTTTGGVDVKRSGKRGKRLRLQSSGDF